MGRAALADALSCRPLRECTNSSGVPMIRFAAGVVAVLATAGVLAGPASAAAKQLWYDPNVDAVASDIAGTAVNVHGEDDLNEWGSFVTPDDPNTVLGFTFPFEPSSSVLFHQIFIAPVLWPALRGAVDSGPLSSGSNIYTTAVAIFDVTHEALHIRLVSGDENRVNACALQIFPAVLTRDFHISATDTKKTTVPVTKTVRVKYRCGSTDAGLLATERMPLRPTPQPRPRRRTRRTRRSSRLRRTSTNGSQPRTTPAPAPSCNFDGAQTVHASRREPHRPRPARRRQA